MYIISVIDSKENVFEVFSDFKNLPHLCDILENSNNVIRFKVSNSNGEVDQQVFGYGGYMKWYPSLYKQNIKKINILVFKDTISFSNWVVSLEPLKRVNPDYKHPFICKIISNTDFVEKYIIYKGDNKWCDVGEVDSDYLQKYVRSVIPDIDDKTTIEFQHAYLK